MHKLKVAEMKALNTALNTLSGFHCEYNLYENCSILQPRIYEKNVCFVKRIDE